MKKIIFAIILLLIIVINFTPASYLFEKKYTYSNIDGSYNFTEESGGGYNLAMAKKRFKWFLEENPDKAAKDKRLYRTFRIIPWHVWQWGDYIFQNERFRLPYKDPKK